MPSTGGIRPLQFRVGRQETEIEPESSCVLDDGEALVVELMSTRRPVPMPISLVYASNKHVTPRLRALIADLGAIAP